MEKKVFVVWNTSYEEDGIAGIFSTPEKAEEYMSHSLNYCNDMHVDEYILDEEKPDQEGKVYEVSMYADNDITVRCLGHCGKDPVCFNTVMYGKSCKEFRVFAVSSQEAIEIAKKKAEFVDEHRIAYRYLGVLCKFRFKYGIIVEGSDFFGIKEEYPTYDIDSGSIILANDSMVFLGPVEESDNI